MIYIQFSYLAIFPSSLFGNIILFEQDAADILAMTHELLNSYYIKTNSRLLEASFNIFAMLQSICLKTLPTFSLPLHIIRNMWPSTEEREGYLSKSAIGDVSRNYHSSSSET